MGSKSSKARDAPRTPTPVKQPPEKMWKRSKWAEAAVLAMVRSHTLAPLVPAADTEGEEGAEECPICCTTYPGGMNTIRCCGQLICSDCFITLQTPAFMQPCPFCSRHGFRVGVANDADISRRSSCDSRSRSGTMESVTSPSSVVVPLSPCVVTTAERAALEKEMARQHMRAEVESDIRAAVPVLPPVGRSPRRARGPGVPTDLAAVEELMFAEVMRLSLLECDDAACPPHARVRPYAHTIASALSSGASSLGDEEETGPDQEEALLMLALQMSMEGPRAVDAPPPPPDSATGAVLVSPILRPTVTPTVSPPPLPSPPSQ